MAILLFQDLAVVAFLIVLPRCLFGRQELAFALAAQGSRRNRAWLILFAGEAHARVVPSGRAAAQLRALHAEPAAHTLARSALELAGLSLALGSFLAGMLIAETEYRYQVEEDIKPFRDVLLGLFFVTVGMALDLAVVAHHIGWVVLLLIVPVGAKLALIVALSRVFGASMSTALRNGFYLAQAGEFALVLLALAVQQSLVPGPVAQVVLAAMVLSMLSAPLLIHFAESIVRRFTANDWLARAAQITKIAATTMARQNHVIICGYGRSGQNLARLLEAEEIAFIALDADPERVREAAGDGSSVVYGDAGRKEALFAAGLAKARAVVITFADTAAALKILHHVHTARPELQVVVRTIDDSELDRLLAAGAAEVVPEVLEGSLMLATHSLLLLGVPLNRVLARIRAIREERYSLFRGFFHGASDVADAAENLQPRLHSIHLPDRARAVGNAVHAAARRAGRSHRRAAQGRALAAPGPDWASSPATWSYCLAPGESVTRRAALSTIAALAHGRAGAGTADCERQCDGLQCRSPRPSNRSDVRPFRAGIRAGPCASRVCRRARRRDVRLRPAAGAHRHLDADSARWRGGDHGRLRLRQDDDPASHRRPAAAPVGPGAGRRGIGARPRP
jgi:CPA2 family monovalent cation:H+ antiporter-2